MNLRGTTAFVDDLVRDIAYAFRTFRRAPLAVLTIVVTLALGLGLLAAVFTLYSAFYLHVDAVQDPGELFAVIRPTHPGARSWEPFTRADYDALRRETSVFTDAVAMVAGVGTRIDGRPLSATLVTGNFFQVLGVRAALGRTLAPGDDHPSTNCVIVFSHRGWLKLFAGDPNVIGRILSVNGVSCEVAGVTPEGFRGLAVTPPDYWAPLALAGALSQAYAGLDDRMRFDDVVGRLKPGVSARQATAALEVWALARSRLKTAANDGVSVLLRPRQGTLSTEWVDVLAVWPPIFFAFGLILMIGCANVANLLLARGVSRQGEIAIRLSLGASPSRVVRQLITESLLLALGAAAGGLAVSRMCLAGSAYAAAATMPAEFAERLTLRVPPPDWRVVLFLLACAIVATVSFGLVPALQAARVELARAGRAEATRGARPGRARHALIAVQVAASALLLICAAVFLRSAYAAALAPPVVRTGDTIMVPIANEPRRPAIVQELIANPSVVAVSASSPGTLAEASVFDEPAGERVLDAVPAETRLPVDYKFVSPGYFQLLGIDLVRGRSFTDAERSADARVTVVSERIARRLWPNGDAIGQIVRIGDDRRPGVRRPGASSTAPGAYTVIGIARDVESSAMLREFAFSGVYLPAGLQDAGTSLTLRVRGDPEQVRLALLDRLTRIDPALDVGVRTLRTMAGMGIYLLRVAFWSTFVLGALALALTVSGLFSVLSYLVEQRVKEFGVRVALGATTRDIMATVLSQSVRPVVVGLVAGGGLAAALATVLISTPIALAIGDTIRVLDPLAYAASVLVIITACVLAASVPALRAARVDPIVTLRTD
jgi:predicted permease